MWAAKRRGSILASHPTAPGSIASMPTNNSDEKLWMLLRLVNGICYREMDRGLNMLIEPI